jgi:hypothetical protein
MQQGDKAMTDKTENIYKEVVALCDNSRNIRSAHFIAAQGKRRMHRILGVGVIILNIMIFSPLFDLIAPTHSAIIIKFLAIFAASLAGLQTLFNYQKDVESHLNAGNAYTNVNRKARILLAEYKDNTKDVSQIIIEFKELTQEYLRANEDNKACIPSDREFDKARELIKGLDEKRKIDSPTKA